MMLCSYSGTMSNKKRIHACMQSHLLCLTLCDPMDGSLPRSSVHAIFQAILEWVAMPSSRGSSQPRDQTRISYMTPALAGRFFITSTTWEAQEKNELLINLTPWKDLKTGCAKKAEHRTKSVRNISS